MNSVIYTDFELILVPYSTCNKEDVTTKYLDKHVTCGYTWNVVTDHDKQTKQTHYRGDNVVATFCKEVRDKVQDLINMEKKPMQELTKEQQIAHDNAQYCHICKRVLGTNKKHIKVRDHDHFTGEYRGTAHVICNLRYSKQIDIPVYLYNGSNYDFYLIINELAGEFKCERECVPLNTNKYMSFSVPIKKEVIEADNNRKKKVITYNIKFMHTARHKNRPLSTLVDNLSELYECKCAEKKR